MSVIYGSPDGPRSEFKESKLIWEVLPYYWERRKWTHVLIRGQRPVPAPQPTPIIKNPILEARKYAQMYALPSIQTYAEVGAHFGVSRARVCQMMSLLKLPEELVEYIAGLTAPENLQQYTERRLRYRQDKLQHRKENLA